MRFRSLLLALATLAATTTLPAGPATAEAPPTKARKAKPAVPPYRLVRILAETHQALLYDRNRGTHVLVDAGSAVGAYEVTDIATDHVVLSRPGDSREFVLVAGEATPTSRLADPYPIPDPAPPAAGDGALIDPYPAGVLDPYGSDGVRETVAPDGQRASDEPAPPTEPAPPVVVDPTPTPVAPVVVDTPREESMTVARQELDAALSDFAKIGKEVDMTIVAGGVRLDRVATSSFFHRVGLRDGDLVTKVDGTRITGLDDAAVVYARLGKARRFTVAVDRGGAPLTLRFQITK